MRRSSEYWGMLMYVICTHRHTHTHTQVIHKQTTTHMHTPTQLLYNYLQRNTWLLIIKQIWASSTDYCLHRNSLISLYFQTGWAFMNRFHWWLEHFTEHTPWYVNYPVKICLNSLTACLCVSLWLSAGEGCGRCHPAADVVGEGRARGEGDRADCFRVRQ